MLRFIIDYWLPTVVRIFTFIAALAINIGGLIVIGSSGTLISLVGALFWFVSCSSLLFALVEIF